MLSARRQRRQSGVTLAEFAIVFPIFITITFAMIEFGMAFNAVLSINHASQTAALVAAQAGNEADADCLILARVEQDLQPPINKSHVLEVDIVRTGPTGTGTLAQDSYVRSGTKNCGTYTVPYTETTAGYPENQRCNILAGCPTLVPPRSTVDQIAVQITYQHDPVTPMRNLLSFLGASGSSGYSWTFVRRNVSRMEPVL